LWGANAHGAAAPRLRLDLPPGPLAAAVATLAEKTGASIGASDPRLLAFPLPAVHLQGSPDDLVADLARRAGVTAVQTGPDGWRIEPHAAPPPPKTPPPTRDAPTTVTEIVVPATKRAQPVGDYPAEIVQVTGADLGRFGAAPDTGALTAQVPILTSTDWGAGQEKLFLRGISDSSFTGTSPALVGEYLGDQPLTYDAPDPDLRLYDVQSVAVMAGPQGTLYGAGALGGLIRIEPNAPVLDSFGGSTWLGGTNTAHGGSGGDVGGVVNLPLVEDRLALRVVGYAAEDPGYIDDTGEAQADVNRVDTRGGRATLRWALDDIWRIDLGVVAQRIDNHDASYVDVGGPPLTRTSTIAQPSHNLFLSESLTVVGRIGDIEVRSTTGVVDQSLGERFEALRPGGLFDQYNDAARPELLSQETRLSHSTTTMSWVVGVSYVASWDADVRDYGWPEAPSQIGVLHDRSNELTGYGEATRKVGGGVSVTFGARYASVRQSGDAIDDSSPFMTLTSLVAAPTLLAPRVRNSVSGSEQHLLPSAALSYDVARGATLYVRYGQGFRPGGMTLGSADERFTSDRLSTLETGVRRGTGGVDRVALSLTGALSQWRNIQADLLNGQGMPEIANIGNGRISSVDASVAVRIVAGLTLNASGFLQSSRLDPPSALAEEGDADTLPNVARNGGALALDYRGRMIDGRPWEAGVRVQHVGPSVVGIGPLLDRTQGDYTTVALGGGVRFGAAELVLNVSNLLDCHGDAFAIGAPIGALSVSDITPVRPRTVRLGVRYDL
jgi:outer membrane receptor protein involved in Fe transport